MTSMLLITMVLFYHSLVLHCWQCTFFPWNSYLLRHDKHFFLSCASNYCYLFSLASSFDCFKWKLIPTSSQGMLPMPSTPVIITMATHRCVPLDHSSLWIKSTYLKCKREFSKTEHICETKLTLIVPLLIPPIKKRRKENDLVPEFSLSIKVITMYSITHDWNLRLAHSWYSPPIFPISKPWPA